MSVRVGLLKARSISDKIQLALLSLILAILSIAIFIVFFKALGLNINVSELIQYGFTDMISSPENIAEILFWATPLIFTGLSVAVAFQAGLFNIGGQGQMAIGGTFGAVWAAIWVPKSLSFLDHKFMLIPTTILVGMIFGGIWGFIPGYLKARYGSHEVIITIMMNYIASGLIKYLVGAPSYSPFVDRPESGRDSYLQTPVISAQARFDPLFPTISERLNSSFLIAIFVAITMYYLIFKTNFGFRLRSVGLNNNASLAAGINSKKVIMQAMTLSGALSGAAGALLVMGLFPYRYQPGMEKTIGFDGIAVSLLSLNSPIPILLSSLFFALLLVNRPYIDRNSSEVPPDLVIVFQALIILFAASPLIAKWIIKNINPKTGRKILNKFNASDERKDINTKTKEDEL